MWLLVTARFLSTIFTAFHTVPAAPRPCFSDARRHNGVHPGGCAEFVDQFRATRHQLRHRRLNVVDFEAEVVHSRATFGEVFGDAAVFGKRRDQFNFAFALVAKRRCRPVRPRYARRVVALTLTRPARTSAPRSRHRPRWRYG